MISDNIHGGHILRIASGIITLAILLLAGSAGAATWTVNATGGANYSKIQDAIDYASAGDTILVHSGTYYENVNVNKQLILRGVDNGGGMPLVDGSNSNIAAITLNANGSMLDGFVAMNQNQEGIKINSNNNIIKNNTAMNSPTYGIHLYSSNNNTLSDNIINSNGGWNGNGVHLESSNNNTFIGNNVSSNFCYGIVLMSSDKNELNNNIVNSNYCGGIRMDSSRNNILINNNVNSNGVGITLFTSSNNNTLRDNIINLNNYNGVYILSSNNNLLTGNYVSYTQNGEGIPILDSSGNNIYNNYLNNTNNAWANGDNSWNTTVQLGTNIVGGSSLGGNFWANPSGTGLSQTCTDTDSDGICDSPYILDSNNIDYLPLAVPTAPPAGAPDITSFSPLTSTVMNNVGATRTFNILINQTADVSWQINGIEDFNEAGVITSSYTNTSAAQGTWNVNAVANNANGTAIQTWVWIVKSVPTTGSISGFKINDINGNGKWNTGEEGISNWSIRLIGITGKGNASEVIRKETLTDVMGFYKFDNLPAGRYFVIEKLKRGFVPTSSPVKRIKLAHEENSMNNNFTNRPVHSIAKIDSQRDMDDYETINKDIEKYIENMD